MGHEACKTAHCGPKKGFGAYWGCKTDAKRESNRRRREDDKAIAKTYDTANQQVERTG